MFAPKGREEEEGYEVARLLRKRYGPFVQNADEMERLLQLLSDVGLHTMADVAARLRKSSLYALSPPVPMAVLTLLHEVYGQQVMRSPVYGDVAGKFTDQPLPIWTASKRLLADVFFFFEYMFEDGDGADTHWPHLTRTNRASFKHSSNPRLPMEDKKDYYGHIAIRDTHDVVRVEILRTLKMDKFVGGTKEEMIRKTSSHLTQSQARYPSYSFMRAIRQQFTPDPCSVHKQAHFVKRNIFEEEIKELRKKYELGVLDSQGCVYLEERDLIYQSSSETGDDSAKDDVAPAADDGDAGDEGEPPSEAAGEENGQPGEGELYRAQWRSTEPGLLRRQRSRSLTLTGKVLHVSEGAITTTTKEKVKKKSRKGKEKEAAPKEEKKKEREGGGEGEEEEEEEEEEKAKRKKMKPGSQHKAHTLDAVAMRGRRIAPSNLAGPHNYEQRMNRRKARSKSLDMVKKQLAHALHHNNHHHHHSSNEKGGEDRAAAASVAVDGADQMLDRHEKVKAERRKHRAERVYSFSIIGVRKDTLPLQPELDDGHVI